MMPARTASVGPIGGATSPIVEGIGAGLVRLAVEEIVDVHGAQSERKRQIGALRDTLKSDHYEM
jgi:hypothetical protein